MVVAGVQLSDPVHAQGDPPCAVPSGPACANCPEVFAPVVCDDDCFYTSPCNAACVGAVDCEPVSIEPVDPE